MKIIYMIPYDWGGMAHYTAELANAVSEYADVVVLCSLEINKSYFNESVKLIRIFGKLDLSLNSVISIFSSKNIKYFLSYKNLNIIYDINPDIIHITTPVVFPTSLFIKFHKIDKKYPIIYTNHYIHQKAGIIIEIIGRIQYQLDRLIKYKKVVVHTKRDMNTLISKKIFDERRIVIIPHGVYKLFEKKNEELNTTPNDHVILFFGYIRYYKGLNILLRSMYRVRDVFEDVKLIIAGEGDLSSYMKIIKGLGDTVEIHNYYISDNDVAAFFSKTSIVVLPYIQMSGQSGALNVAYAFGKPVIATDVCGLNEIIEQGVTGYLIPPNNCELLAEAIIKLLRNKNLRQQFSDNIKIKCQDLSWDKIAKKHINMYEDVLSMLEND